MANIGAPESLKEPAKDLPTGEFFIYSLGTLECKHCGYRAPTEKERPDYSPGMRVYQMVGHYAIRHPQALPYVVVAGVKANLTGKESVQEQAAIGAVEIT